MSEFVTESGQLQFESDCILETIRQAEELLSRLGKIRIPIVQSDLHQLLSAIDEARKLTIGDEDFIEKRQLSEKVILGFIAKYYIYLSGHEATGGFEEYHLGDVEKNLGDIGIIRMIIQAKVVVAISGIPLDSDPSLASHRTIEETVFRGLLEWNIMALANFTYHNPSHLEDKIDLLKMWVLCKNFVGASDDPEQLRALLRKMIALLPEHFEGQKTMSVEELAEAFEGDNNDFVEIDAEIAGKDAETAEKVREAREAGLCAIEIQCLERLEAEWAEIVTVERPHAKNLREFQYRSDQAYDFLDTVLVSALDSDLDLNALRDFWECCELMKNLIKIYRPEWTDPLLEGLGQKIRKIELNDEARTLIDTLKPFGKTLMSVSRRQILDRLLVEIQSFIANDEPRTSIEHLEQEWARIKLAIREF